MPGFSAIVQGIHCRNKDVQPPGKTGLLQHGLVCSPAKYGYVIFVLVISSRSAIPR